MFLKLPKDFCYETEKRIAGEIFGKSVVLQSYKHNSIEGFDVYFNGYHQFWTEVKPIEKIIDELEHIIKQSNI